jgi:hypothetical protein
MNTYDHYAEAKRVAQLLSQDGRSSEGHALMRAMEGTSGTEIFMKLRHLLRERLVDAPGISAETAKRIRVLYERVDEALR